MPSIPPLKRSIYLTAVEVAENHARDALAHITAEEDAGRLTPLMAADERVRLLENHLERLRQLRREYLS